MQDNKDLYFINDVSFEQVKTPKLTKPEKKKIKVIRDLLAGKFNGPKAAKKLKITNRQVRNLKRQVIDNGDYGVIHKNHFNKPANTYDEDIRTQLAYLYKNEYKGTNFTEFARIMKKEYGYQLSRSTIYNILREKRIRSPQRKKRNRKKKSKI
ncbi:MAG: hypothetical protein WC278_01870 [Bacilli bacterium]|jgi:hypothetical protein|nr:hypothetical protein [Bacilli bacterium]MDD2681781.1 hypothetical protein [Bacilli bacterium]MDD3121605.1 hypothetical protein [Bacilli bacterium]MDD4062964.1 hypothetical protein [Bacilli bacterium]MDD4482322.1 hypothetical protein [Bacilli bacterium]